MFFTSDDKVPLNGWNGGQRPKFRLVRQEMSSPSKRQCFCPLFQAHTCYNILDVPDTCLQPKRLGALLDKLRESIVGTEYGQV